MGLEIEQGQTVHKTAAKNSFEVESTDATNNPLICKDDIKGKKLYKQKYQ